MFFLITVSKEKFEEEAQPLDPTRLILKAFNLSSVLTFVMISNLFFFSVLLSVCNRFCTPQFSFLIELLSKAAT
jgi:hypothetical protein